MSENQPELWELAYSKVISLSINFIDIGGSVNAGIVLSNLWYWKDKGHDPDGWIYKTQNDWYNETRLTVREMSTARKLLRDRGLIEEKKSGIPAKLYYRINKENLKKMTESRYPQNVSQDRQNRKTRNAKTAEQETLKPQNSDRGNVGTVIADLSELSYITTNTTTKTNNKESETPCEQTNAVSFFSDLEPDSEPPTQNPPLLVKPEIKAEDQPNSGNQISETDQDLSVTSGKEDPPLPPPRRDECKTSTDKDLRFDKKIPFPGDIDSAPYCQELCFLKFELPDELALGTKQIIQSKRRVFGRQLLCLMNDQGIDPIANLSKFLKFYFDKNLANNTHYKGKEYDDLVQSQTAQAIANKIKDSDHAVLVQTIAEFKKKITKAAQPAPQPRSLEPLPERGDYVLPDMSSVFEANKKRLEEQIKRNKEKRLKTAAKTAANSKKDISTISDPLLAAEAKLTQNPEAFEVDYDF